MVVFQYASLEQNAYFKSDKKKTLLNMLVKKSYKNSLKCMAFLQAFYTAGQFVGGGAIKKVSSYGSSYLCKPP